MAIKEISDIAGMSISTAQRAEKKLQSTGGVCMLGDNNE